MAKSRLLGSNRLRVVIIGIGSNAQVAYFGTPFPYFLFYGFFLYCLLKDALQQEGQEINVSGKSFSHSKSRICIITTDGTRAMFLVISNYSLHFIRHMHHISFAPYGKEFSLCLAYFAFDEIQLFDIELDGFSKKMAFNGQLFFRFSWLFFLSLCCFVIKSGKIQIFMQAVQVINILNQV